MSAKDLVDVVNRKYESLENEIIKLRREPIKADRDLLKEEINSLKEDLMRERSYLINMIPGVIKM